jgi:hypothetical protein
MRQSESNGLDGDLLAIRHRSGNGKSTLAIWAQRDRVAAEWKEHTRETIAEVCGCDGRGPLR